MNDKICSVEGCSAKVKAKKLCVRHYERMREILERPDHAHDQVEEDIRRKHRQRDIAEL